MRNVFAVSIASGHPVRDRWADDYFFFLLLVVWLDVDDRGGRLGHNVGGDLCVCHATGSFNVVIPLRVISKRHFWKAVSVSPDFFFLNGAHRCFGKWKTFCNRSLLLLLLVDSGDDRKHFTQRNCFLLHLETTKSNLKPKEKVTRNPCCEKNAKESKNMLVGKKNSYEPSKLLLTKLKNVRFPDRRCLSLRKSIQ